MHAFAVMKLIGAALQSEKSQYVVSTQKRVLLSQTNQFAGVARLKQQVRSQCRPAHCGCPDAAQQRPDRARQAADMAACNLIEVFGWSNNEHLDRPQGRLGLFLFCQKGRGLIYLMSPFKIP